MLFFFIVVYLVYINVYWYLRFWNNSIFFNFFMMVFKYFNCIFNKVIKNLLCYEIKKYR